MAGISLEERLWRARVRRIDLARAAGVSPGFVTDVLTGRKRPSRRILTALRRLEAQSRATRLLRKVELREPSSVEAVAL